MNKPKWNEGDLVDYQNAISVVFINESGDVLVQDHVKLSKWTVPVGKVEPGDTVLGTVCKEMREELGVDVLDTLKIGTFKKDYHRYGKDVTINNTVFIVLNYSGTIVNNEPEKHTSLKWVTFDWITGLDNGDKSDALMYLETVYKKV